MVPLQGALKHRTQKDIDALTDSLNEVGLLQPFALWGTYILDGHGRHAALMQMSASSSEIWEADWPVVEVVADTIEQARAQLLEMNSKFGKITPKGLELFLRDTPTIKVPVSLGVKAPSILPKVVQHAPRTHAIIKLRVEKEQVPAFTSILKELSYVEIV